MPQVVRAFPLLKGQEERLREFAQSLAAERAKDAARFYAGFGITRESWHLQETPAGPWVIAITEIDAPAERGAAYAESNAEFDSWFKDEVRAVTGIDPNTQPLGPPTRQVFAWPD